MFALDAKYGTDELYGSPSARLPMNGCAASCHLGVACGHILQSSVLLWRYPITLRNLAYLEVLPVFTDERFSAGACGGAKRRSPTGGAA